MTKIESNNGVLKATPEEINSQLSDLNNLKNYLPSDKISNWESDGKSCSFKVMGTYTIGLEYDESSTTENLILNSNDKSPFPFTLNINLNALDAEKTDAKIICEAKLNPMLKMMVAKPLKNLFDYIVKKAEEHYS